MASPKLLGTLSESDFLLVRATQPSELRALDEEALIELHARVRQARNKHSGIHRRQGAARVSAKAARGAALNANERNAGRVEVFEEALARVSQQLSVAARQSARELKAERLSRARGDSTAPKSRATSSRPAAAKPAGTSAAKKRVVADTTRDSPGRKKREAGTKATGARRQAKRDSRSRG